MDGRKRENGYLNLEDESCLDMNFLYEWVEDWKSRDWIIADMMCGVDAKVSVIIRFSSLNAHSCQK